MARQEGHVVAERKEIVTDRVQQLIVVAAWKIRAPDRAREQDVADDREAAGTMEEHDMPRCVAGTVLYLEPDFADRK